MLVWYVQFASNAARRHPINWYVAWHCLSLQPDVVRVHSVAMRWFGFCCSSHSRSYPGDRGLVIDIRGHCLAEWQDERKHTLHLTPHARLRQHARKLALNQASTATSNTSKAPKYPSSKRFDMNPKSKNKTSDFIFSKQRCKFGSVRQFERGGGANSILGRCLFLWRRVVNSMI